MSSLHMSSSLASMFHNYNHISAYLFNSSLPLLSPIALTWPKLNLGEIYISAYFMTSEQLTVAGKTILVTGLNLNSWPYMPLVQQYYHVSLRLLLSHAPGWLFHTFSSPLKSPTLPALSHSQRTSFLFHWENRRNQKRASISLHASVPIQSAFPPVTMEKLVVASFHFFMFSQTSWNENLPG